MKTIIEKTALGEYLVENIEVNTAYKITHLDNQEPRIEKV